MNLARVSVFVSLCFGFPVFGATNFVNFETAPIHPLALSANGDTLTACNLPDGKVEFFDLRDGVLTARESVSVGIDPVTARFRNERELWVVNAISDSINIIDAEKMSVVRVISTRSRPADVVFAGTPLRAFVTCPPENIVQVFDPDTGDLHSTIEIPGERPKAMAVSADRSKVYVAIFESGNGTTILAPHMTDLRHVPAAGPVDLRLGPYAGANPPPNSGTNFLPTISTNLPASNAPPRVSLIVKKQKDGRWFDDNNGDWTDLISGTDAPFSGRVPGWDLLDHDVAVIDANSSTISFVDRLMNICLDLAVNPKSGKLAVIGTDAINHIRYEPVLKSIFTRAHLALAEVDSTSDPAIADLNPHLDYKRTRLSVQERAESVGDPRGVTWNPDGTRLYVTGMGSDNVVMLDASGKRLAVSSDLPSGPSGIVFDPVRKRVYVLSRFASSVSVLDADTLAITQTARFFDPTPEVIRKGRPHFYNTRKSSGLGQAACASCHVDGRFDRLAWDLGSQVGEMKMITPKSHNFVAVVPGETNHFHPMKGPMVTQTLQDIIGHEPFHWRGDRAGLEEFNPTFTELQGADDELTDAEMQEFEDFLATIHFPPNRFRNFDNSLPQSLALKGHSALGRGQRFKGDPLPTGNAIAGMRLFGVTGLLCSECHTMPSGVGPDKTFNGRGWATIPVGPKGEHHAAMAAIPRSGELPFKVAQLRSASEKLGLDFAGVSRAGFGLFHDGRVDSFIRFVQDGFDLTDDQQTADVIAFLLSFSGSDLPTGSSSVSQFTAPGDSSRDVPAATGKQLLLSADSTELGTFMARANASTGRVDLIVKTRINNVSRGWFYNASTRRFRPDGQGDEIARASLFANAVDGVSLLFTLVPKGTGQRLGIDRDEDGVLDFDELQAGTDPADPNSGPGNVRIFDTVVQSGNFVLSWKSPVNRRYNLLTKTNISEAWAVLPTGVTSQNTTTNSVPLGSSSQSYFRVEVLPQ